jgi:16S rRNA (cytosine967-C5)-methyltransferase
MRFQSYFNTAIKIIELYDGAIPLSRFLKKYFSENKKHGSKDRKFITHACYNYYRPGFALKNINIEERLKVAIFLCNSNAGEWNILYDDNWIEQWNDQIRKRIFFIQSAYNFSIEDIFPFYDETSEDIDKESFALSHLIQPYVFLRIRNNDYNKIIHALHQHHIVFENVNDDCIAVDNSNRLEEIINIDEEAVIQDYSSQKIKEFFAIIKSQIQNSKPETLNLNSQIQISNSKINVWDCCAGSGGKSILAYDVLQNINLTVSDIRPSIIHNLKKRFEKAGIKKYKPFVVDITKHAAKALPLGSGEGFDLIICDAPCTGSGTWSRTPEQLYFFQPKKIEYYSMLQQKIVSNAIKYLKHEGYFLYITCSVFKAENEDVVKFIEEEFQLTLIKTELLKGYNKKADTMFAALLKK